MRMELLDKIDKTRDYLDYVEEHILNIRKAFYVFKCNCEDMSIFTDYSLMNALEEEVRNHDLSKLSEEEFIQYRKAFHPTKDEIESSLSNAWLHHQANNPHHWQNWTKNFNDSDPEWVMHCSHMIIDWMAMGYKFGGTAQGYYEKNKEKIDIPDYAIEFIYEIFNQLPKE